MKTHYLKLGKESPYRLYRVVVPDNLYLLIVDRVTIHGEEMVTMDSNEYWNVSKWIFQRNILKDKKAGCNIKKRDLESYLK